MADDNFRSYYGSLPQPYEFPATGTVYVQPAPQIQQPALQAAYSLSVPSGYSNIQPYGSYTVSNALPLTQPYSNMAPLVTVQYAIQQPVAGVQYVTADYGTGPHHTTAHFPAHPYAPTCGETSLPVGASAVNYDQYHSAPVAAQSFVYTVPQHSPYQVAAVGTYQMNVQANEMPNVYTSPANNMSGTYSQSYEQVNYTAQSNTFNKPLSHGGLKPMHVPHQTLEHSYRLRSPSSVSSSYRSPFNHEHKAVSRSTSVPHISSYRPHFNSNLTSRAASSSSSMVSVTEAPTIVPLSEPLRHCKSIQRSLNTNVSTVKRHTFESSRHKEISKPIQLHHCSICKITCAGKQLYQEHLESDKHKKMVENNKSHATADVKVSHLSCEKCHVFCGNADAYAAHVRSVEHQKVLKSHSLNSESTVIKSSPSVTKDEKTSDLDAIVHPDIQPIGLDMIKENGNKAGLFCKLCNREIELSVGKMRHCKTRGHRQQYKNKVDSKLFVEAKPVRSFVDGVDKPKHSYAGINGKMNRRLMEEKWRMIQERRQFEAHLKEMNQPSSGWSNATQVTQRYVDSYNDNCVNSKHSDVYPTESELAAIQDLVSTCEKCLKLVSDNFESDIDIPCANGNVDAKRLIKGVMRVGFVAKGLLVRGDHRVELVLLCLVVPMRSLLQRIVDEFPKQLATFTDDTYNVRVLDHCAAFTVSRVGVNEDLPDITCVITLTSPLVRQQQRIIEPKAAFESNLESTDDILDHGSCLAALAAVRHAKWFQAKVIGLPSCVVILRVLRAIREHLSGWNLLTQWAVELLVEKCLGSVGEISLTAGNGLRRVFEAVASGILLRDGPGLFDPCEKDAIDVVANLTDQQREDITSSAQRALRLIALRKINDVLCVDETKHEQLNRHRKRSNDTAVSNEGGTIKLMKTEVPSSTASVNQEMDTT